MSTPRAAHQASRQVTTPSWFKSSPSHSVKRWKQREATNWLIHSKKIAIAGAVVASRKAVKVAAVRQGAELIQFGAIADPNGASRRRDGGSVRAGGTGRGRLGSTWSHQLREARRGDRRATARRQHWCQPCRLW